MTYRLSRRLWSVALRSLKSGLWCIAWPMVYIISMGPMVYIISMGLCSISLAWAYTLHHDLRSTASQVLLRSTVGHGCGARSVRHGCGGRSGMAGKHGQAWLRSTVRHGCGARSVGHGCGARSGMVAWMATERCRMYGTRAISNMLYLICYNCYVAAQAVGCGNRHATSKRHVTQQVQNIQHVCNTEACTSFNILQQASTSSAGLLSRSAHML